jgi:hypothetical protein
MSMIKRTRHTDGLQRGSCLSCTAAQILESTQEVAGERPWNVIPRMDSKLPRWSSVTSQQIGQIAISKFSVE